MVRSQVLLSLGWPLLAFALSLAGLLTIRHLLLRLLVRKATRQDSFLLTVSTTIRAPSLLWSLAAALVIALQFAELKPRQEQLAGTIVIVFLIASFSLAAAALAVRMIALYGERQGVPFAVAGLSRTLTYVFVLSLGTLIVLRYLGLTITPMLTALGVGGLAVALALQDTLANFFAGVHILVEKPVDVGDFIRLSSGEEGVISDIGWRTTRVETGLNNTVVIPNTKITSSILTNYSLPERRTVVEITVIAAHTANAERVQTLALEVAAATEGVLTTPPPLLLFDPGVTPTHLQFKLLFSVADRTQQGLVASELRMRLLQRFQRESIPLPALDRAAS